MAGTVGFSVRDRLDGAATAVTGLSTTAAGAGAHRRRAGARHARRLPARDPRVGWPAPIGVALLAFLLRVHRLGTPKRVAFDETYYAKDAWSLLHFGYVKEYLNDADGNTKTDINADIIAGHTNGIWTRTRRWSCTPRSASG